jgi:hypothetical protein
MSYEIQAVNYRIQATSYKISATNLEAQVKASSEVTRFKIASDDRTVL